MGRVVVFGSSNTDMTVRLPRLPAPGQTLLGHSFLVSPGGKGANQAVAARRAGAEVELVSAVGDDDLGRQAIARYLGEGIGVSQVRVVPGAASGVALIFVGEEGENMIGVAPGANQALSPADIDRLPDSLFRPADVALVGLEIPLETAIRALERARSAGMTLLLNPAPAPAITREETQRLLSAAQIITPNRVEALALAGMASSSQPDWSGCFEILLETGIQAAVITLGSQGCLMAVDGEVTTIPAPRVEAIDTVGAGDAFNGALAVALSENRPLRDAVAWACAAAALAVTKTGAQQALPSRESIDRLFRANATSRT